MHPRLSCLPGGPRRGWLLSEGAGWRWEESSFPVKKRVLVAVCLTVFCFFFPSLRGQREREREVGGGGGGEGGWAAFQHTPADVAKGNCQGFISPLRERWMPGTGAMEDGTETPRSPPLPS